MINDVQITLSGEPVSLRYTPRAAKEINSAFGSFTEAVKRVEAIDYAAIVVVVAAGLNKTRAEVETPVFDAGFAGLVGSIATYLVRLANGGRDPSVVDVEGAKLGEG